MDRKNLIKATVALITYWKLINTKNLQAQVEYKHHSINMHQEALQHDNKVL